MTIPDPETSAAPRDGGGVPRLAEQPGEPMLSPGVDPLVSRRLNAGDEARAAALWLVERYRDGCPWRDMVVVAPGKRNWRDPLAKALGAAGVPFRMLLGEPAAEPDFSVDRVHVMTLYAVADLSPATIAIVGIGDLPWKQQTLDAATGLVRAAMSRATQALAISYSKESASVGRLIVD